MKVLKCLSPLISSPLSQIINESFQCGIFPDKISKIYNELPIEIRKTESFSDYSNLLKKHFSY